MFLTAALLLAAVGCGVTKKLTGSLHPNTPPQTVLFVNGSVDTVNHVVQIGRAHV